MIKKIIFILAIFFASSFNVLQAQCMPNFLFTSLGIPGVYPPEIPIPNIPLVGMTDGTVNTPYSETLTLIVLEDTSLDIGFLLPGAVVTTMNSLGISTVMSVDVNHVTFDVQGLPNGLSWVCNQNTNNMCVYNAGVDGCIAISGTPTQSGTFSVPVSMTIQIQIPAIPNPVPGLPAIFGGTTADIPTFNAVEYDLLIQGNTSAEDHILNKPILFPNPTDLHSNINFNTSKTVQVFDIIGNKVLEKNNVNQFVLSKKDVGSGIFIIRAFDKSKTYNYKLLIN